MSYPLSGVNFTDQEFTPTSDTAIWRRCISDGVLNGFAISSAGSSLNIAPGWIMCGGKELQLASALTIPVTGAVSGYARVLATADLSGTSSYNPETGVNTFTQGFLSLEYSASRDGFASLTQQDLAGSGTVYQMVVCVMSLGSAGITGIVSTCGDAHGRAAGVAVTLLASGWANNFQTVRCDGVTADKSKCHVVPTFDPENEDAYTAAGIRAYAQGDGTVTFRCSTEPDADIPVNVLLL